MCRVNEQDKLSFLICCYDISDTTARQTYLVLDTVDSEMSIPLVACLLPFLRSEYILEICFFDFPLCAFLARNFPRATACGFFFFFITKILLIYSIYYHTTARLSLYIRKVPFRGLSSSSYFISELYAPLVRCIYYNTATVGIPSGNHSPIICRCRVIHSLSPTLFEPTHLNNLFHKVLLLLCSM